MILIEGLPPTDKAGDWSYSLLRLIASGLKDIQVQMTVEIHPDGLGGYCDRVGDHLHINLFKQ